MSLYQYGTDFGDLVSSQVVEKFKKAPQTAEK